MLICSILFNWFDQNNGTSLLQIKKNTTYGRETLSKN